MHMALAVVLLRGIKGGILRWHKPIPLGNSSPALGTRLRRRRPAARGLLSLRGRVGERAASDTSVSGMRVR
jgi:hypothetical protein